MEEQHETPELMQSTFSLYTKAAEEVVRNAANHAPPEFVAKVKGAQSNQ